jgi:hypothetical protein
MLACVIDELEVIVLVSMGRLQDGKRERERERERECVCVCYL